MTNAEIGPAILADPVVLPCIISLRVETEHARFNEQHQPDIDYLRWRLDHHYDHLSRTSLLRPSQQGSHHAHASCGDDKAISQTFDKDVHLPGT